MRFLLTAVVAVLLVGLVPAATPTASAQSGRQVRLDVSKVTPSVVRSDSAATLTVTGTLTNTGQNPVTNLEMRVHRGAPRATKASVIQALRGNARTDVRTRFVRVADRIAPGQRVPFTMRVELSGGPESLGITRPGVYPLMLNLNADLASGVRARVAETRFMLPVLSPPGQRPSSPRKATPITMLIPLVDYPRMVQEGIPGRPTILIDDRLAQSLSPGGRLYGLVHAVSEEVPQGSPLGKGLCFAIDPALVSTAKAMTGGYLVRERDGGTHKGTGAEAAKRWLAELESVTENRCVIALPYSDADIVALGRAGLPDVIRGALDGAGILRRVLGVDPRREVLWPINGALDEPAATQLGRMGIKTVLMHPDALAVPEGSLRPKRIRTSDENYTPTALPVDPLLAGALNPLRDSSGGRTTALSPIGDTSQSVQNTLGALTFRATRGFRSGATSILAPPRRWNLSERDLRNLLSGVKKLAESGYVAPTGLPTGDAPAKPSTLADSAPGSDGSGGSGATAEQSSTGSQGSRESSGSARPPLTELTYPVSSATNEIRQDVLDELAAQNYKVGELYRAAEEDPAVNVPPAEVTTPLRNGLLRGASSAWRGNPGASRWWVHTATETLEDVLGGVRITKFAGKISLTSSTSPIPVTVTNHLPVTVGVYLHVDGPPGIEVDEMGLLKIPAGGSRQFLLEAQVELAGKFAVDITIRTEGGTQLGETRRLQLESNTYGTIPLVITLSGAALLLLLSARRIVRRTRGARAARSGSTSGAGPTAGTESTAEAGPDAGPDPGVSSTARDTEGDRQTE